MKKVSLLAGNCTCEQLSSSSLRFPAITWMSYILIYFIMYFTTAALINYFIGSV